MYKASDIRAADFGIDIRSKWLPLSSPRVAQLDLAYHDVHRGRGQYYPLQRSGAVDRVVRDLDGCPACRQVVVDSAHEECARLPP